MADVGQTLRLLRQELPAGSEPSYATRLRVAVTTELRATVERPGFVSPQAAILAIRAGHGSRGHPHLGRRRPQALARPAVPGLRAEHRDHQQRLRDHGIGLPGAIAAALALPERRAVTVSGDGGFLMNVQEMETATRLGLRVVVVVWVDGAYGVIGWKQERRFGRTHAIEFGNPGLARAGVVLRLDPPPRDRRRGSARRPRGGARRRGPALVTVPIDYRQNVRLASLGEPALGA